MKAVRGLWRNAHDLAHSRFRSLNVGSHSSRIIQTTSSSIYADKMHLQSCSFVSARIHCSAPLVDRLSEALMCFGANSITLEGSHVNEPSIDRDIIAYFTEGEDVGACLAMAADSIGLKELPKYELIEDESSSWLQQVQETFKPTQITHDLWIVPFWRSPPDPLAMNVLLDPGLAFGSGDHPTTQLCLCFLKETVRSGDQVLDYGTGSGILGIAAVKMGAARVIAVDTDPMAISSANHNTILNELEPEQMQVYLVSDDGYLIESKEYNDNLQLNRESSVKKPACMEPLQFDIVVANILLNPLLSLASYITGLAKPGGLVGISGIVKDQVPEIQKLYSHKLENISVSEIDGWAFLKGTKKETRVATENL